MEMFKHKLLCAQTCTIFYFNRVELYGEYAQLLAFLTQ